MIQIEIIVQALAESVAKLEVLGLRIAMQLVGPAGLDATEYGDETGGTWPLRSGEAADEVLLALRARGEVVDAPEGVSRASCSLACLIRWLSFNM